MKKQQSKRVIPGFGLTMGVTLAMLSIVVLIPLASLAVYSARLGLREFIEVITRPRVLSGFYVSFITAFAATVINAIMGLVLAWVLVRYDFPGKRIMDGMIELPFALPTAVAGISLTSLTSDKGLVGSFFANFGIKIAYTRIGITVALIFVGIPFVSGPFSRFWRSWTVPMRRRPVSWVQSHSPFFAGLSFRSFCRQCFPGRDLPSDVAWENTEALFLSQETSLTIQRSRR